MVALMFQGTGSDVGKSLLVAGLCRAFTDRGLRVRPFKPQNMSNNAAVTADGGEIGRAQALQARAARCAPQVDMNPVLLKPQGTAGAQIVVQGRVFGAARAAAYQAMKRDLLPFVLESFSRLSSACDLVLVEGAGSASEINLRANDIANMGFARAANVPVAIIGDIHRGGVIASLVGTKAVLDPEDERQVCGFIINRMHGDIKLFDEGMRQIATRTGWAPLGLVPHFAQASLLPAEDSLALDALRPRKEGARRLICVPILPHVSNFDDLDPLDAEPALDICRLSPRDTLPPDADLVLLVGSKATRADLDALRAGGLHHDIIAFARRGGRVMGLCGGYQILGTRIADPDGVEGPPGTTRGLGLLDVATILTAGKTLTEVTGRSWLDAPFRGYEMHMGETAGPDAARPFARLADGRADGAVSASGRIAGSYVHGLFADDAQRAAWLAQLGAGPSQIGYDAQIEATLDALAAHLAASIDLDRLLSLAR
ncbi:cobyric acid synthase [Aquabacter spiritensis]|uniref:Cobyric acid synthase n=1 Tax=Aquabacter spiritensis TaxID=933073 RepID=A0A4R3LMN1_9HYPH|nr:cobyric acid synthase [Aquabacter spiritensis]TCT01574.1 adenosylcobyric acid synthase (glutamine-hydrolysing) [Aquabacter spiritensis]